jgi:hypothetical protein
MRLLARPERRSSQYCLQGLSTKKATSTLEERASKSSRCAGGSVVTPNTEIRSGRSTGSPSASRARKSRCIPALWGWPIASTSIRHKPGLPALGRVCRVQGSTPLPPGDHLRPEDQVAVEEVGYLPGQPEAEQAGSVIADIVPQDRHVGDSIPEKSVSRILQRIRSCSNG